MKFSATREQILGPLQAVIGVVERKQTMPVLANVLLAAKGTVAFHDPNDTGPYVLVGRHGSLTPDEMLVPLLVGVAG